MKGAKWPKNLVYNNILSLISSDPTAKPSVVYREEVDRVRDPLTMPERVGFDLVMPVSK